MAKGNLKAQVVKTLNLFLAERTISVLEDQPAYRYVHSILLLISKDSEVNRLNFIKQFHALLKSRGFPLLKVELVLLLYNRWKLYPAILFDLNYIQKSLRNKSYSYEFYEHLIYTLNINPVEKAQLKARIQFFVLALNSNVVRVDQTEGLINLQDVLLNFEIERSCSLLLDEQLTQAPDHQYYSLLYVLKLYSSEGASKEQLLLLIQTHFSELKNYWRWTNELQALLWSLDFKLPAFYLLEFTSDFVGNLLRIYKLQPTLIERIPIIREELPKQEQFFMDLFKDFMIPGVMLRLLYQNELSKEELKWFDDELSGKNIFKSKLPLKLSNKGAHIFRNLDYHLELNVVQSMIYAEVLHQIRGEKMARAKEFAFTGAKLLRNNLNLDFWTDTLVVLYEKGLEIHRINEILDYLQNLVFVRQQPINLRTRSLETLRRDILDWHEELNDDRNKNRYRRYQKLAVLDIPVFNTSYDGVKYRIKQLTKATELYEEGKILSHCVHTYSPDCHKGYSYIFSLRSVDEENEEKPLITIEVGPTDYINQANGKYNRFVFEHEAIVIKEWARINQLMTGVKSLS